MKFKGKKKLVVVGAAAGSLMFSGVAFALWSANATGSGNAKALTATSVTVTATTGTADLYPGFTDGDLSFTLTNTNPYPVTFSAATPGTITSSAPGSCAASLVTVDTVPSGLSIAVAAGATSPTRTIVDIVNMDAAAGDGCQGVTFTIALTLTGTQA